MSVHIQAVAGEIAETVLISGDPLRAKYVAAKMLTDVVCYNEVRGMLGFTGMYNGKLVSVQGTGMGIPSTAIYAHELIHDYGVKKLIRVGTCGAIQSSLKLGTILLASSAYTDSGTHLKYSPDMQTPTHASEILLRRAKEIAAQHSIEIIDGAIFSTDIFYGEEHGRWDGWIKQGLLGVEMESSVLYGIAKQNNVQALSILTVSDNIITKEYSTSKEREEVSLQMIKLALESA